jgi:hypothetical protein
MFIYEIKCIPKNESYIGATSRACEYRWKEHRYKLKKGKHTNKKLQNYWNKYGENCFEFNQIEECKNIDHLNNREIFCIKKYGKINFTPGGNASKHKPESIKNISKKQMKPVVGMCIKTGKLAYFNSIKNAEIDGFLAKNIGKCCNLSLDKKTGSKNISSKGYVWMYQKEYNNKEMERRRLLGEQALTMVRGNKPIAGKCLKTGIIVEFKSAAEAGRNSFKASCVTGCCTGSLKSHKGFVWVYKNKHYKKSLNKKYNEYEYVRGPKCQ